MRRDGLDNDDDDDDAGDDAADDDDDNCPQRSTCTHYLDNTPRSRFTATELGRPAGMTAYTGISLQAPYLLLDHPRRNRPQSTRVKPNVYSRPSLVSEAVVCL